MKLNINKNAIKKGLWYSTLSLMLLTVNGCTKDDIVQTNSEVTIDEVDNAHNDDLTDVDTMYTLNKYNEHLGEEVLTEDDLKVLSMYNVPMIMVKSENGYSQVGENYYVATTKKGDIDIVYSNVEGEAEYDMLTGEKLSKHISYTDYESVAEFIVKNNIEPVGYALPYHAAYTTTGINMIESIYGEEVAKCAKENGIPVKVYSANDFYKAKEMTTGKVMSKK